MTLAETQIYEMEFAPGSRRTALLAPYDLNITIRDNIEIRIGRFSFGVINRVRILADVGAGRVLTVGAFCEVADDAVIVIGGEHRNDSLLNYTFGNQGRLFRLFMDAEAQSLASVAPAAAIEIGDNVIISTHATILSGTKIGAGCVIGADALVIRECGPGGIYAGIPAQRLRDRHSPERAALYEAIRLADVMAHHIPDLPKILARLEHGDIRIEDYLSAISFLPARPVIHLSAELKGAHLEIGSPTAYALGETRITDPSTLRSLDGYFSQIFSAEPKIKWTADIFRALGLY